MESCPITNYDDILKAVKSFDERKYAGTRNFIDGHVSRFSPYISRGCISTRTVFEAIIKKNPKAARGKFVQELLWRDYFQRLLQARPNLDEVPVKAIKQRRKKGMPASVRDAKTGVDGIDQAIATLYETGYMHNHFRMYTAAVCCNIGNFEFQTAGRWLYYHLLDADVGSNFASWQWVSGHLTNKQYIANQENINRYSRIEQHGTFLDKPYPELEHMRIPTVLAKGVSPRLTTELPKTEFPALTADPVLLYTFYNLDPKWHARKKCNRVLILEPSHFKAYPISKKVLDFTLKLARNIKGLKVFVGEFSALKSRYPDLEFCSKEHPILRFDTAKVDARDWIVPEVEGYFQSFSKYYLKCLPYLVKAADQSL